MRSNEPSDLKLGLSSEAEVEGLLRKLHQPRVSLPDRDVGERAALELWEARHGGGRAAKAGGAAASRSSGSFGLLGLLVAHRMAVAAVALVLSMAVACVLPTSYDVPLGLSIEIRAVGGVELPAKEIATYVQSRSEASQVDVMIRELRSDDDEPTTMMQIRLWDQSLALGEIGPELREAFPSLSEADIEENPLEGEVETIWARRLAHTTFDLALKEADVEDARVHLLMQLHAQGLDDDEVTVKVRDREDGHREIEVRIEQHHDGDGHDELLEGLGPGFQWKMDPDAPEQLEFPARHEHEPVRIQIEPFREE